jgi:heme/copper-type cytochrome/quinol oxidase subunit 2
MGPRIGIALALGLLQTGCVALGGRWSQVEGNILFSDERPVVQVVTTSAGGKNFFVPSTLVVTSGSGRKLSLFNTTDAPHGFQIPSLGVELILQPGVETPLDLPPLEAGHIYAINCHLHPPHRGAALVVLPAAPTP